MEQDRFGGGVMGRMGEGVLGRRCRESEKQEGDAAAFKYLSIYQQGGWCIKQTNKQTNIKQLISRLLWTCLSAIPARGRVWLAQTVLVPAQSGHMTQIQPLPPSLPAHHLCCFMLQKAELWLKALHFRV